MSSTPKMIKLKSSDGEIFEVEESVAALSQTIKHMIEDDCADTSIPLPNVTSQILAKVIEYCKRHVGDGKSEDKAADEELKADLRTTVSRHMPLEAELDEVIECFKRCELRKFDAEFVKVDRVTLFDLILAAEHLNIHSLLDLTSQTAADMIKGKTAEEIREFFNIKKKVCTPEEEEEVRRENAWAFE